MLDFHGFRNEQHGYKTKDHGIIGLYAKEYVMLFILTLDLNNHHDDTTFFFKIDIEPAIAQDWPQKLGAFKTGVICPCTTWCKQWMKFWTWLEWNIGWSWPWDATISNHQTMVANNHQTWRVIVIPNIIGIISKKLNENNGVQNQAVYEFMGAFYCTGRYMKWLIEPVFKTATTACCRVSDLFFMYSKQDTTTNIL